MAVGGELGFEAGTIVGVASDNAISKEHRATDSGGIVDPAANFLFVSARDDILPVGFVGRDSAEGNEGRPEIHESPASSGGAVAADRAVRNINVTAGVTNAGSSRGPIAADCAP